MSKYRDWCFTFNNYTDVEYQTLQDQLKLRAKYFVIGKEKGENGTPHLQGYVVFQNSRAFGGVKKEYNDKIHWENRIGTHEQAAKYCKKDNDFVEYGEIKQGHRKDLVEIRDSIVAGKSVETICMEDPMTYHQYGRTLNKIEDIAMRKKWRNEMTRGVWYWGKTGVGKSHHAFEDYNPETHYVYPNDGGWWDGYTQQDTVIINDFRGEIPYNEMLQMIDKWPFHVRRRNREPLPFVSKTVIITSSLHPRDVFKKRNERDSIEQLIRRLDIRRLSEEWSGAEVVGEVILDSPTLPQSEYEIQLIELRKLEDTLKLIAGAGVASLPVENVYIDKNKWSKELKSDI